MTTIEFEKGSKKEAQDPFGDPIPGTRLLSPCRLRLAIVNGAAIAHDGNPARPADPCFYYTREECLVQAAKAQRAYRNIFRSISEGESVDEGKERIARELQFNYPGLAKEWIELEDTLRLIEGEIKGRLMLGGSISDDELTNPKLILSEGGKA